MAFMLCPKPTLHISEERVQRAPYIVDALVDESDTVVGDLLGLLMT